MAQKYPRGASLSFLKLSGTLIFTLFILNACSHRDSIKTFSKHYYAGQNQKALDYAVKEADSGDVLWNLQAGITGFELQSPQTYELLENGEKLFSQYEQEGLLGGVLENVGAVLVNDNIREYRGNIYEGVMFHYYKALNAMSFKDYALARVEFNRANDRQRRAKDYFHKDVQKAFGKIQEQKNNDPSLQDTQKLSNSVLEGYSNLDKLGAYEGFINPAVSYVSALFFMLEGDYTKALDLYKESYAISKSPTILKDLEILKQRKQGKGQKYTWVIIEDGSSPYKKEITLNVPVVIPDFNVTNLGVSLPVLIDGKASAQEYNAQNGKDLFRAYEVADMDKVIRNEFNKQLSLITTYMVTSALVKMTAQVVLYKNFGSTGLLAGMLYSTFTNNADVRISTALPKQVLALQIPNVSEGFSLYADSGEIYRIFFQCNPDIKTKIHPNIIVLCAKNDNILHIRIKTQNKIITSQNLNYRILKGAYDE